MSSDSESDDDYKPEEPVEKLSEEDTADEETDLQFDKEVEYKAKKRKSLNSIPATKKRKFRNGCTKEVDLSEDEEDAQPEKILIPEEEKKKEDDLWALFKEGTESKPKPSTGSKLKAILTEPLSTTKKSDASILEKELKNKQTAIFEFAGEKVVVEDNAVKQSSGTSTSTASPSATKTERTMFKGRPSGNVASLLGQLTKKNQLSTLEKSKLDWNSYKKEEGIEEEVQTFNKGKQGYLERQDFLERADHRQFEIERALRTTKRSNR